MNYRQYIIKTPFVAVTVGFGNKKQHLKAIGKILDHNVSGESPVSCTTVCRCNTHLSNTAGHRELSLGFLHGKNGFQVNRGYLM